MPGDVRQQRGRRTSANGAPPHAGTVREVIESSREPEAQGIQFGFHAHLLNDDIDDRCRDGRASNAS